MKELKELCKNCLGCNKLENPEFEGTEECENYTLEQVIQEQMKMEGLDE